MATFITADYLVPEGDSRTYTSNGDGGISAALYFSGMHDPQYLGPSLINHGLMQLQASDSGSQIFVYFDTSSQWGNAIIDNDGTIDARVPGAGWVKALYAPSWGPDLHNAGTITVEAQQQAIGYECWGAPTITNTATGSITASAGQTSFALYIPGGGTVINAGNIVATATGGTGIVNNACAISSPSGTLHITNSGLIEASDNSDTVDSVAINFYGSNPNTVVNSGTIRGDYAIREYNPYGYNGQAVVENSGLIDGSIALADGNDIVRNSGQINGIVDLGANEDVYDGHLGRVSGTVLGGEGSDLLIGGASRDTLNGGAGEDVLFGGGGDTLTGGSGADTFVFATITAGAPAESITDFVSGTDRIDLRALSPTSVTVSGGTVTAVTASGTLVIHVTGSITAADILAGATTDAVGTTGSDALVAGPGGANLVAGAGADLLVGGAGNDRLDGGGGDGTGIYGNVMWGGAGDDTYVVSTNTDVVLENAGSGYDTIEVAPGMLDPTYDRHFAMPDNVERLIGWGGIGNALDNVMVGSSASDEINGAAGADVIDGAAGNDTLSGGSGNDTLTGGAGSNIFLDSSSNLDGDTITDFQAGDRIVITDASLADFSFSLSGTTLNYSGGTLTLQRALTGTLVASQADGGGVQLTVGNPYDIIIHGTDQADVIYGSFGGEAIYGLAGNDTISGGGGSDQLYGGSGDDTYIISAPPPYDPYAGAAPGTPPDPNAHATVVENAGEGTDLVQSEIDFTLGANVENLTLIGTAAIDGTGNELANILIGNDQSNTLAGGSGNDVLTGNGGNDVLDGGTGVDVMTGGGGDDIYVIDNARDVVTEAAGDGTDTVRSSIDFTLGDNFENLAFTGTAATVGTGNALANVITGNDAVNVLSGGAGDDTLAGGGGNDRIDGGSGADAMSGGAGNDLYYVDNSGDVVTEAAAEGTDTVRSSVGFTLGANVERLTLTGTAAIDATGNALANVIYGNTADNVIDGGDGADTIIGYGGNDTLTGDGGNDRLDGRSGADTMAGGIGNDVYYVDQAGDSVIEHAGEGIDLVASTISYSLGSDLERLTLTGTAAVDGYGNALDNVIRGNGAANHIEGGDGTDILSGGGGNDTLIGGDGGDRLYGNAGADTMSGGTGNDAYYVDDASDMVIENANEGSDTVVSSIGYTLGANVERLVLSGSAGIAGTGNGLDNKITGNAGDNVIDGGSGNDTLVGGGGADTLIGGAGKDTMTGGAGNDLFVFHDGDLGSDRITDFTSGQDRIDLSAVDANSLLGGAQGFSFIGSSAFSHTAGELHYEQTGGSTYLSGDTNGDGIADFVIQLDGLHTLASSDLVL